MKLHDSRCQRGRSNCFRAVCSATNSALIIGILLLVACATLVAQGTSDTTFDITSDEDFKNYHDVIRNFLNKHPSTAANDFCIVGYVARDSSKQAWILWRQGRKIILWERGEMDLNFSRRTIDLRTDVVNTDSDLHGSTYLVTKAWVDNLTTICEKVGTKLSVTEIKNK